MQIMNSTTGRSALDPRTKLLLLLMIAVFVLSGTGGGRMFAGYVVLCIIPLVLFVFAKDWKGVALYVGVFAAGYAVQAFLLPWTSGVVGFLLGAVTGILTKMFPGIMMGRYMLKTTTVSEFIAAMERIHMSDKITIPLSVLFRFFPTIGEEAKSISDAMKMRGIGLGGDPIRMVEYRLIPMMTCSVRIGEELSAAALTRGLGSPVKRTNVCNIGFRFADGLVIVICAAIFVYWIIGLFM